MQTKQLLLAVVVAVAAVVTTALLVGPTESPETGPYLSAEPAADVPDDAAVREYEQLSPAQQDVFERAISDGGEIELDGEADIDVWYETEFVRHDGQLYRILVAEV